MPQPPREVLESLALLEEAGDLCADLWRGAGRADKDVGTRRRGLGGTTYLPCLRQRVNIAQVAKRNEGFVPLSAGESQTRKKHSG